jgi:hypothetical protein
MNTTTKNSCDNCSYRFDYYDSSGNHDGEGCEVGNDKLNEFCGAWEGE